MRTHQTKGYLFEVIVGQLLKSSGYSWSIVSGSGNIQGRGAPHQIDAIGINSISIPFVNNIRLLAEAKYFKPTEKVELDIVRNMLGVLIDVNEVYRPQEGSVAQKLLGNRNTNCAVIFSNQDFSENVINYGYAHNIYLVSYAGNPAMKVIVDAFEKLCNYLDFTERGTGNSKNIVKERFYNLLSGGNIEPQLRIIKSGFASNPDFQNTLIEFRSLMNNSSSILGFIGGSYPIHIITSNINLLHSLLISRRLDHNGVIKVGYNYSTTDDSDNVLFSFNLNTENTAYFSLPKYIFPSEVFSGNNMISFKEEYLKSVIVPVLDENGIVSLLKLEFDKDLINEELLSF